MATYKETNLPVNAHPAPSGSGASSAGLPPPVPTASGNGGPLSFDVVFAGRILSDQDRPRAVSVGAVLLNPVYQARLREVAGKLQLAPGYGPGESKVIGGIRYTSLFRSDWQLELNVLFLFGRRTKGQSCDVDSGWAPFQNALAWPSPNLVLKPKAAPPCELFTLVPSDHQFAAFSVRVVPYPVPETKEDVTVLHVTALPPPHLALTRPG